MITHVKTKTVRAIVLGIWGLFVVTCFAAYSPLRLATSAADQVPTAAPPDVYAAHCATCHGSDGRAKTAKGKRSGATDFTSDWNTDEARGIRIISNGKGEMPSFKGKLSSQEIRGVFARVLRFKR
jgi:mono/diheme cytochrome c family protein